MRSHSREERDPRALLETGESQDWSQGWQQMPCGSVLGLVSVRGQEICRGRASMTLSAQSNQARGSLALPGSLLGPPPVDCSPAWLLEPESLKISKQRTHYSTTKGRRFLASILPTKIVFLDLSGY